MTVSGFGYEYFESEVYWIALHLKICYYEEGKEERKKNLYEALKMKPIIQNQGGKNLSRKW